MSSKTADTPESYTGKFAAYRIAGLRHVSSVKSRTQRDPCVALTATDPRLQAWRSWWGRMFGAQPWEARELAANRIQTLTVPCDHPDALTPQVNAVRAEMERR